MCHVVHFWGTNFRISSKFYMMEWIYTYILYGHWPVNNYCKRHIFGTLNLQNYQCYNTWCLEELESVITESSNMKIAAILHITYELLALQFSHRQ